MEMIVRGKPGFLGLVVVAFGFSFVGCGGGTPVASQDSMLLGVISGLSDASGSAKAFANTFATGAAPKDSERARYKKCAFRIKASSISGDIATVTVEVVGTNKPDNNDILGEVQWTATKIDKDWKLTAAPLPDSVK